ncbi:MAG TPA: hypothetical protein VK177_04880 [Flavobacteriales bacterium]|nr:hypothetical protein [Flavobacteriales bacterium]
MLFLHVVPFSQTYSSGQNMHTSSPELKKYYNSLQTSITGKIPERLGYIERVTLQQPALISQ